MSPLSRLLDEEALRLARDHGADRTGIRAVLEAELSSLPDEDARRRALPSTARALACELRLARSSERGLVLKVALLRAEARGLLEEAGRLAERALRGEPGERARAEAVDAALVELARKTELLGDEVALALAPILLAGRRSCEAVRSGGDFLGARDALLLLSA